MIVLLCVGFMKFFFIVFILFYKWNSICVNEFVEKKNIILFNEFFMIFKNLVMSFCIVIFVFFGFGGFGGFWGFVGLVLYF